MNFWLGNPKLSKKNVVVFHPLHIKQSLWIITLLKQQKTWKGRYPLTWLNLGQNPKWETLIWFTVQPPVAARLSLDSVRQYLMWFTVQPPVAARLSLDSVRQYLMWFTVQPPVAARLSLDSVRQYLMWFMVQPPVAARLSLDSVSQYFIDLVVIQNLYYIKCFYRFSGFKRYAN